MQSPVSFLGVDLGASNGRVIAAHWDGYRFELEELHRFANSGVRIGDRVYWDVINIWAQILGGFRSFNALHSEGPAAIGIDAWGIDYGLLDARGRLISNPVHYRDRRTEAVSERLFEIIDEKSIFSETGVQSWRINTLFQLFSMVLEGDAQLELAETLLTIPDLFSYFLSGAAVVEFTEATTTQLFSLPQNRWAKDLLRIAGIPERILPAVVQPSSRIGLTLPTVVEESRFSKAIPVIAVASHDTASAIAAIPELDRHCMFISNGTWSLVGIELSAPNTSDEAYQLGFTNEGAADGRYLLLKNLAGLWIIQECIRQWETGGRRPSWNEVIEGASIATAFRSILDPNDKMFELPTNMPVCVQDYCVRTAQLAPQTVGEFARVVFEGLALSYRRTLSSIERLSGKPISTIRIVGGGSQNQLLSQMVADACNRLVIAGPVEATLLGNILAQAIAIGHIGDFQQGRAAIARSFYHETYEPHPSTRWDDAFARFQQLGAWHEENSSIGNIS